ncbi:hypothetical protein Tco_0222899 [Tanacetum coccineum]
MPQDQEGDMDDNEDEPMKETASRRPPQNWLMTLATSTPTDKLLKDFDELMSTPIDFSVFIINECYKALSEKLDWENPEGGDYPFDLSKPLPLITHGKRQKTKAAQYDLPSIEDMVPNIWSPVKRYAINGRCVFNKAYSGSQSGLGNDNILYKFKEGDFPRLWINDIEDMFLLVVQNRLNNLLGDDVADFVIALRMYTRSLVIQKRNRLMRLDKLYKFSDGTLTRLLSLLKDITKNINMTYLPNRKWSTFEKKRAHFIIKDINKLLKERKIRWSFGEVAVLLQPSITNQVHIVSRARGSSINPLGYCQISVLAISHNVNNKVKHIKEFPLKRHYLVIVPENLSDFVQDEDGNPS